MAHDTSDKVARCFNNDDKRMTAFNYLQAVDIVQESRALAKVQKRHPRPVRGYHGSGTGSAIGRVFARWYAFSVLEPHLGY